MESLWGTLKTELIYRQHYRTRAEAKSAIFAYIEGCITANVGIHRWAISALNSLNNSFRLNSVSVLLGQGQFKSPE